MKTVARFMAVSLCAAGVATAATTNEYVGTARLLNAANQWSPASAPTDSGNIRNWLIGGSGFKNFTAKGDLVVNSASPAYRVYADTVYIAAGINSLTSGGVVYDLGFNVAGSVDNRIVVKTGFDIAAGVTNNVALKSTQWASANANNQITFNHAGSGILKISNDWVETPNIALAYNGTGGNKVEFGLASTYTGGTTLNNVSAKMLASSSIGNAAGNVVLTNGASLDMATYTLGNKIVAAAGADVKQVSVAGVARTSTIEAQGDMRLYNTSSATAQWNGNLVVGEGAELEVDNAVNGVTQLGGTLSGSGTLRTSDKGTTLFNTGLNASGFNGDIVMDAGVAQFRNDNQFGSGNITLNGANLRGFITSAGNLDYSVANDISVQANSRMAMTASTGLSGNNGSVTVDGDISFTENSTLTLEAGGNADNFAAVNTLNINGVISESSAVGNVTIDNHWTTSYYTNSATRFSAANTYSGNTEVQFGRLQLVGDGSIDSSSTLVVREDGILDVSTRTGGSYTFANNVQGIGLIEGEITLTGLVQPGPGTGTLNFGDALNLEGAGILAIELYGYGNNDKLANDGEDLLTFGANRMVQFSFANWIEDGAVTNGTVFSVFENWGSFAGTADNITVLGLSGGQSIDASNLLLDGTVTVIPEPTVLGLVVLMGAMTLFAKRLML